jgi:phospholipase/lecithinase/hemolysin
MKRIKVEPLQRFIYPLQHAGKTLLALGAIGLAFATTLSGQTATDAAIPPGGIKLQIVSFGDSLSDAGTYSPSAAKNFNGGLFTTNPGTIWTQQVAAYYGDNLKPAFEGGFGQPLQPAGGLGFGQGGSRVSLQPGVGHAPAGTPNADFALQTTVPVATQVNQFLSMYGGFKPNQLVLINGGANDLLTNLQTVQTNPLELPKALFAIDQAAVDLADVVDKVIKSGAQHVVLLNLADFGKSPEGVSSGLGTLITTVVRTFNDTLTATLLVKGDMHKVIMIDAFSFLDQTVANFQSEGFTTSDTGSACDPQAEIAIATKLDLPNPTFFSDSLFCSPQTLVAPNADQTFIFADSVHPTTHYSNLFAKFVEQQIAASGLGR